MTIKEFSQKHSLVFFWATIVLVTLFLLTICIGDKGRHMMKGGYDYERYDKKMMYKPGMQGQQRQMMDTNNPNQPLINDTPSGGAAGTVETGTQANPNIPLEVQ
jgi:hypothetical protein